MYYDYRKAMIQDIKDYIWMNDLQPEEGMSQDEYLDYLSDELWDKDEITGNGPKFYDTEDKCAEYVCHNLPLYFQAADEFGELALTIADARWLFENPAQHMDTTIRCYLLSECLNTIFSKDEEE